MSKALGALLPSLISSASLADRRQMGGSLKIVHQQCTPAIVCVSAGDAGMTALQLPFVHSLLRSLARQGVVLHLLKLIIALVSAMTY